MPIKENYHPIQENEHMGKKNILTLPCTHAEGTLCKE